MGPDVEKHGEPESGTELAGRAITDLLPCPFCGRHLVNVTIDQDAGWAEHPWGTDCYFDGYEFDMFDPARWNIRA